VVAVTVFFAATRTGLALRALSDDPGAAMVVGIDVRRHLSIAWGLGGGLAVVAGTLWTLVSGGGFSVVLMGLRVFPVVILGGLDSVPGTILAAVLVGVLESLAAGYADPWLGAGFSSISSYVVLLGVLLVRPHGLLGRVAIERI
jgi:branched-chain amino acid transport system permease protein